MAAVTYRLKEVDRHQGRDSCWIIIDGKVYDVTKYVDQHPGGDQEILNEAGTDATKAFDEVGHSSDAKEILETFLIGYLHADDVAELARKKCSITCAKITAVAVPVIAATIIATLILLKRK